MKGVGKSWISWSLDGHPSDFEILGGVDHKTHYSSPGMSVLCIFYNSASTDYYEIHSFLPRNKMLQIPFASTLLSPKVIRKWFQHNSKLCGLKYSYQKLWKFQKIVLSLYIFLWCYEENVFLLFLKMQAV